MTKVLLSTAAMIAMTASANAAVVTLDFEGVGQLAAVNDFYNGGTDSAGNSGVNYGVNFSSTSLGIIDADAGGTGNFANEPSASTVLFFLSGGAATLNFAAGFDTGFSFFYSALNNPGSINVYDGLDATGSILATLNLPTNSATCIGDPTGGFCEFSAIGVAFSGTAKSVDFAGTANQIAFDNITFGSATPGGAVPEPATWAMMIGGFGAIGGAARYRRRSTKLSFA
ncbi:MAG: PEPxxWA-CTERM sorting domain-containing protein [Sphingomonadaceae bacterium]